uniref:Uncharacterized protein n=1 Tax=Rhizophora mucronata TaxID=61149 RepID=A0A2P2IWU2_RHIMU
MLAWFFKAFFFFNFFYDCHWSIVVLYIFDIMYADMDIYVLGFNDNNLHKIVSTLHCVFYSFIFHASLFLVLLLHFL